MALVGKMRRNTNSLELSDFCLALPEAGRRKR